MLKKSPFLLAGGLSTLLVVGMLGATSPVPPASAATEGTPVSPQERAEEPQSLESGAADTTDESPGADDTAPEGLAVSDDGAVSDMAALKRAVEALEPGPAEIVIAEDFAATDGTQSIALPAGVELTLTGAVPRTRVTLQAGTTGPHVRFSGSSAQSLTLNGLAFIGHNPTNPAGAPGGTSGGGVSIEGIGAVEVSDSEFSGIDGSSGLALAGVATLDVTRSSFLGNRAGNSAAIGLPTGIAATITDSSFAKNHGTSSGYSGGAIRLQGKSHLTIERSVFADNLSTTRGGAIAFHQMDGTLTIRDSVFERNTVPIAGNNSTLNDGGAIAVNERPITGQQTGQTRITGTTFTGNSAGDEGGAILAQSGVGSSFIVENSTFFENVARGLQSPVDNNSGGGAIEAFGTPVTLLHNTFINNIAERGNLVLVPTQRGGAVSAAGDKAALPVQPLTLSHNLFVGNDTLDSRGASPATSAYRQVNAEAGIISPDSDDPAAALASNIGVDNGKAIDRTVINAALVLGTDTPAPAPNGSSVVAGDPNASLTQTPGTFVIHPADGEELTGIAWGVYPAAAGIASDQRGYPVAQPAHAGSVQQSIVRFDPNGGDWESYENAPFDGNRIVQRNSDEVAIVWAIAPVGSVVQTEAPPTTTPADMEFTGWNTSADGSGTFYQPGDISLQAERIQLFAQWEQREPPITEGSVTVEYVDDAGDQLGDPLTLRGAIGAPYTTERLEFDGYELLRIDGAAEGVFAVEATKVSYVYEVAQVAPPVDPEDPDDPDDPNDPEDLGDPEDPNGPAGPPSPEPATDDHLSVSGSGANWGLLAGSAILLAAGAGLMVASGRRSNRFRG